MRTIFTLLKNISKDSASYCNSIIIKKHIAFVLALISVFAFTKHAQSQTAIANPSGTTVSAPADSRDIALKADGYTFVYSNSGNWPACTAWGLPKDNIPIMNGSTTTPNSCTFPHTVSYSANAPTNLAGGVACFTGTATTFKDRWPNVSIRMIVSVTNNANAAIPLKVVGNYVVAAITPTTGTFKVKVQIQAYGPNTAASGTSIVYYPSASPDYCNNYANTWAPAIQVFNCLAGAGSNIRICTQFPGTANSYVFYNGFSSAAVSVAISGVPADGSATATQSQTYTWTPAYPSTAHPASSYQYKFNNGAWTNSSSNGTGTSQAVSLSLGKNTFCVRYYNACNATYYPNSNGTCRTVYYTPPSSCGNTIDWGGNNWTISANATVSGKHINIGNFTVNSGVTATVAEDCEFYVEAANVNIAGTINADGKGKAASSGGSGGSGYGGLGCDVNNQAYAAGGVRATSNGTGTGGGKIPSGNGTNGVGCGQDCTGSKDYAGAVNGGGGAGGGGGGAYGGAGASAGSGGNSGGISGDATWNDSYCGTPMNGQSNGKGSAGGSGGTVYGTSNGTDIDFGSGGAGAGGGGRGSSNGSAGGAGGRGGGKVTIISRFNAGSPYTFTLSGTINANGLAGSKGGDGGNGGRSASNCCSDLCDQSQVEEATNVSGGGAGAGAGGGSGGGVLLMAYGNATMTGTVNAKGGNGGDGGSGGGAINSTYTGGCANSWITGAAGSAGGKGGGGGGGRIKIFYNPCLTNTISASHSEAGGTGNATGSTGTYSSNVLAVTPGGNPVASGTYVWNGVTSTAWHTGSNWSYYDGSVWSTGQVPQAGAHVIIPGTAKCTTRNPTISQDAGKIKDLTIHSDDGAVLTISCTDCLEVTD